MAEDELFTNINPETLSPELKELYKSMQGDYTRKRQEDSTARKDAEKRAQELTEKTKNLPAIENEVTQWRQWYADLEREAEADMTTMPKYEPDLNNLGVDYTEEPEVAKLLKDLSGKVGSLSTELGSVRQALANSESKVQRMFDFQGQLSDLSSKHTDLDKQALLDHALKIGQTNLEKAYKDLYFDDIIAKAADELALKKIEEQRTAGIHSAGRNVQQVIRAKRDSVPKSFDEATEQIIQKKAQEGTLDLGAGTLDI